jgi:hypothetical protein
MDTKIIAAIENGNLIEAQGLLTNSLYTRAGAFLEEKKKQVVAKTWGKNRAKQNLTESDSKSIFNAARRKAVREKMLKLRNVKEKEAVK